MQPAASRKTARPRRNGSAIPSPRRSPLTFVDPDDLVIAGEGSALFDGDRAALPVREEDISNVLHYGVVEPVVARLQGGRVEIVDGKQRVKWAREANRRLRERGEHPMRVPLVLRTCDDREAVGVSVSLNEIRKDDTIWAKAQRAGRMIKLGMTQTEVGIAFGVSNSAICYWLSMLKLAPELQPLAAEGRLLLTDAMKLSRLPQEEQTGAFADIERVRLATGGDSLSTTPVPKLCEQQPAGPVANGHNANGAGKGGRAPAEGSDTSTFRSRLRDLAVYVTQVDRDALDPRWSMLLLWLERDEATTDGMVAAVLPSLAPFFEWRRGRGAP